MKIFILVVNILALTLPFLAAEVLNQEQPRKVQDKVAMPTTESTTIEPTHVPTTESVASPVVTSEASSEFIINNTPETTTVTVTSPAV
ncbi:kappa-casein [Rhynchocyon petersi]